MSFMPFFIVLDGLNTGEAQVGDSSADALPFMMHGEGKQKSQNTKHKL
jgi:hypothetical protein